MPRVTPLILTVALLAAACSGGSDAAPTTTTGTTPDTTPATAAETTTTVTSTTTTTIAPTTTLDDAAILAEAEAAYLEAFEVGKEVIRNPDNPNNEQLIRDHFTGGNLAVALENLRRSREGGFVARVNLDNPSNAIVVDAAQFVDDNPNLARLTVCEFNSDQIFEVGAAPGGGDELRRDDPVTILITVRMSKEEGRWKSESGTRGEEIRDEGDRCADA